MRAHRWSLTGSKGWTQAYRMTKVHTRTPMCVWNHCGNCNQQDQTGAEPGNKQVWEEGDSRQNESLASTSEETGVHGATTYCSVQGRYYYYWISVSAEGVLIILRMLRDLSRVNAVLILRSAPAFYSKITIAWMYSSLLVAFSLDELRDLKYPG